MDEPKVIDPKSDLGIDPEPEQESYSDEGESFVPGAKTGIDISENQEAFFQQIFNRKDFYKENWDTTLVIDGKVELIEDNFVKVICLMDEQKQIFKDKAFPKNLLEHIHPLNRNTYLKIKIKQKEGSIRYDIIDGANLVNKEIFDLEDVWNDLIDFDMDEPLL